MPQPGLFDRNMMVLSKIMDLRSENQQVIASNIANAETPGYNAARFEFEKELQHVLSGQPPRLTTTHKNHISLGARRIEDIEGSVVRIEDRTGIGDKNSVSVDQEMIALSENELLYETAAQLLKKKLGLIKYVTGGGQ